jgi:hypothetical protein
MAGIVKSGGELNRWAGEFAHGTGAFYTLSIIVLS